MAESLRGRTLPYLRAWRLARFIGQAELARQSGVSPSTLARAERGDMIVSWANLRKLAEALDVTPEDLLAGPPAEAPATPSQPSGKASGQSGKARGQRKGSQH